MLIIIVVIESVKDDFHHYLFAAPPLLKGIPVVSITMMSVNNIILKSITDQPSGGNVRIATDIEKISDGFVNSFFVSGKDGVIIIDCGFKSFLSPLLRLISRNLKNDVNNVTILITHADADHVGALRGIEKKVRPVILTSTIESRAIQHGVSSRVLRPKNFLDRMFLRISKPFFQIEPVSNISPIEFGQICIAGEKIVVIDSTGHTPGHVSYFFPDRGVLFSGDSIRILRGKPYPSSGMNTWDENLAEKSFSDQLKIQPEIIAGGHGLLK